MKDNHETYIEIMNEMMNEIMKTHYDLLYHEIKEAHELLNEMGVPTNGLDANGNLGYGKREELSLKQRITYLKYTK